MQQRPHWSLIVAFLASAYILWPSVSSIFARSGSPAVWRSHSRKGRLTTGLANSANDCYANSQIQAMASLPALFEYLSGLQLVFDSLEDIKKTVPFSYNLASMIVQLNTPITKRLTISPWPLLRVLETIYKSRISRSQHDAHELLILMLDTLNNERDKIVHLNKSKSNEKDIAAFPFSGETQDIITCQTCNNVVTKTAPFVCLSLAVPQQRGTHIETLLKEMSTPEVIEGYNCAACQISAVFKQAPITEDEVKFRQELEEYKDRPNEIPDTLQRFLPQDVRSVITRRSVFHNMPGVLCVHLNRSIYAGGHASRNACNVQLVDNFSFLAHDGLHHYQLMAVVQHNGTHNMGHYECSRRKDLDYWQGLVEDSDSKATNATPNPVAQSVPPSQPTHKTRKGHPFWFISDDKVQEVSTAKALNCEQGVYLVYYQEVQADRSGE